MCTMISEKIKIEGSGKSGENWFGLSEAAVSFDHPFDAPYEHALNIDFVNESLGLGARVAVELNAPAARELAETILTILERAENEGHLKEIK